MIGTISKTIEEAQDYIKRIEIPKDFKPTGITKNYYLDIIEDAVEAYPKKELEEKAERFQTEEVENIQAFSRLSSAIAVLLSNGRKSDYMDLWIKFMDACCRDVTRIAIGSMVDFSVKELMLSYIAMSENVDNEKKCQWLNDLKKIDPYINYFKVATKTDDLTNINVYNMVGEYLREKEGLTDVTDYFDMHWPLQFKNFDKNGMYVDPGAPILYDLTTRVQIQLILGFGYDGKYAAKLDSYLKNAGYMTLFMQTSAYQLPFGGRSNQYQFNEALIAANCEYEASRYKRLGDNKTAGVYKRCARLAAKSIERWMNECPPRHIKNFYPIESKFGTEVYGYYDKYMITLGCFIYIAFMFADDEIQEVPCPAEIGGYVVKTTDLFHKVFANCAKNSIAIETKADFNYDATGIGSFHKSGIPTELALSTPFTAKHNYSLPDGLTKGYISISPGWDNGNGDKQYLSHLSCDLKSVVDVIYKDAECVKFSIVYTGSEFQGCNGVKETYTINDNGITIQAELIEPVVNTICYQIPLLSTNGKDKTTIVSDGNIITLKMIHNCYTIKTDGDISIETNKYGNRNGEYKLACIKKNKNMITIQLDLE